MLAFFKRRWILLSCALAMVGCSVCDWEVKFGSAQAVDCYIGVSEGSSWLMLESVNPGLQMGWESGSFHAPMFGGTPSFVWLDYLKGIQLPIWLPLLAVLGWIVFREVRWRAKMRDAAEEV